MQILDGNTAIKSISSYTKLSGKSLTIFSRKPLSMCRQLASPSHTHCYLFLHTNFREGENRRSVSLVDWCRLDNVLWNSVIQKNLAFLWSFRLSRPFASRTIPMRRLTHPWGRWGWHVILKVDSPFVFLTISVSCENNSPLRNIPLY